MLMALLSQIVSSEPSFESFAAARTFGFGRGTFCPALRHIVLSRTVLVSGYLACRLTRHCTLSERCPAEAYRPGEHMHIGLCLCVCVRADCVVSDFDSVMLMIESAVSV